MNRRSFAMAAAVAASCGGGSTREVALPDSLPGGWKRAAIEPVPVEQAPELARSLGVKRVARARFDGPTPLTATCFTMGGPASAFELVQKWKPEPGEMFFASGAEFVVLAGPGMDSKSLRPLADALDRALSGR
jgi:hypothetical protein